MMQPSIVGEIFNEFRYRVPRIFGDNLAFAFICGSFAKGYASQNQDVDCFVCTVEHRDDQLEEFRRWYYQLHDDHNLLADYIDPGEVMTLEVLQEKIDFVKERTLQPVIETYYEYEAIVWCDMISGEKTAKVGDLQILNTFETSCELLPHRWKTELLQLIGHDSEDTEIAKLPLTRLLRRALRNGSLTYLKKGCNTRPNI